MSHSEHTKRRAPLKAGGGQSSALQDQQVVRQFTPLVARYIESIFNDLVSSSGPPSPDSPPLTSYDQYTAWWLSPASAALAPPVNHDLSLPLSNYFISSSHNTYLSGNQLYGASTTQSYTDVLLRGCRCLEIDVWNGEDEASSVSSSDVEDVEREKSSAPRKHGAMSKLKSLGDKAQDKLRRRNSSKSPPKRAPDTHRRQDQSDELAEDLSAVEIAERRAMLMTEPRVYHGYTLTKQIPFREVCEAIKDAAFKASTLPIIVSLEVHCNLDQQQVMVDIMEETWKGYLVDMSGKSYSGIHTLPSPESLRNKILIKVKWTPATSPEPNDPLQISETGDSGQTDGTALSPQSSQQQKAVKIIESLSKLGVYTRAYSFKNFQQPEAKIPTHVFSLDENKLGDIHSHPDHGPDMFQHNRDYLVRIYPSARRLNSSNIDPAFSWRQGAQIVALNWQSLDRGMMLNEGMFAGEQGYVLKPDGFRSTSASEVPYAIRRRLDLTIRLIAGQNLPMPADKGPSHAEHLKPKAMFQLHVDTHGPPGQGDSEQSDKHDWRSKYTHGESKQSAGEEKEEDERKLKRSSHTSRSANPDWGQSEKITWTDVPDVVEKLSFLRVKVKDDKMMARDDLVAWACIRLDRLNTGYRFLHLLDVEGEPTEAVLLVQIEKTVH